MSEETGLQQLQKDKLKHHKNSLIDCLNINSLRNKITDFRVIMKTLSLDYLVLIESKMDENLPTAQFNDKGNVIRARRDQNIVGVLQNLYEQVLYAKDGEITGLNIVNLLLPTKSEYALVSTDRLSQAIFQRFTKN